MNEDIIINKVINKFISRSKIGIKKYGVTLNNNLSDNYLKHLQEELMDACNYIETLIYIDEIITDMINSEPNDDLLGYKIRNKFKKLN